MFRHDTSVVISSILMLLVFTWALYKAANRNYLVTVLLSYFFANGLFNYVFHNSILTRKNATTWLLEASILLAYAILYNLGNLKKIAKLHYYGFILICFVSSIPILMGGRHGLIDAYSFESGMLIFTALMPVTHKRSFLEKLLVLTLIGIGLYMGGSTGLVILALYLLGRIFYSQYEKLKHATIALSALAITYAYKFTDLLSDSGRFKIWSIYINEWHNNANMIIGSGIGTFRNIAPKIETSAGTLIYAHNDFLELYLETGLIGVFCISLLAMQFFKVCYKSKNLHYAAMMFVFAFNYFPLQILLTKIIFLLSILIIYDQYRKLSIDKNWFYLSTI